MKDVLCQVESLFNANIPSRLAAMESKMDHLQKALQSNFDTVKGLLSEILTIPSKKPRSSLDTQNTEQQTAEQHVHGGSAGEDGSILTGKSLLFLTMLAALCSWQADVLVFIFQTCVVLSGTTTCVKEAVKGTVTAKPRAKPVAETTVEIAEEGVKSAAGHVDTVSLSDGQESEGQAGGKELTIFSASAKASEAKEGVGKKRRGLRSGSGTEGPKQKKPSQKVKKDKVVFIMDHIFRSVASIFHAP